MLRPTRQLIPFGADDLRNRAGVLSPAGTPGDRVFNEHELYGDHVIEPRLGVANSHKPAAVLVPLIDRGGELSTLLTLRTANLSKHAGQIAFPGGKIDLEDAHAAEAALRETREEIGITSDHIELIGELDPYLSRTGYHITTVVALVHPGYHLTLNPGEVAETFEVPFSFLMNAGNHRRETMEFQGGQRAFYSMKYQDRYIWGVTAGIIHRLQNRLYG